MSKKQTEEVAATKELLAEIESAIEDGNFEEIEVDEDKDNEHFMPFFWAGEDEEE